MTNNLHMDNNNNNNENKHNSDKKKELNTHIRRQNYFTRLPDKEKCVLER
jgi:hypothetical protein